MIQRSGERPGHITSGLMTLASRRRDARDPEPADRTALQPARSSSPSRPPATAPVISHRIVQRLGDRQARRRLLPDQGRREPHRRPRPRVGQQHHRRRRRRASDLAVGGGRPDPARPSRCLRRALRPVWLSARSPTWSAPDAAASGRRRHEHVSLPGTSGRSVGWPAAALLPRLVVGTSAGRLHRQRLRDLEHRHRRHLHLDRVEL